MLQILNLISLDYFLSYLYVLIVGEQPLLNLKGYVAIDKRIICREEYPLEDCIYLLIMSYYVF